MFGVVAPSPTIPSTQYTAAKHGVVGLTKADAVNYAQHKIRINAICPGTIQSPSLDERIAAVAASTDQTEEAARKMFVDRQPMGRLGTAQEVANLALFLACDESSYITGQAHLVDGGMAL